MILKKRSKLKQYSYIKESNNYMITTTMKRTKRNNKKK